MTPTVHFQGQTIEADVFHARTLRAASALRAAGVGEGDCVALMLRNGPLALEVMLAARWLGALWCPINWHFKTDEVNYILSDSGARVFVADRELLAGLGGLTVAGRVLSAPPAPIAAGVVFLRYLYAGVAALLFVAWAMFPERRTFPAAMFLLLAIAAGVWGPRWGGDGPPVEGDAVRMMSWNLRRLWGGPDDGGDATLCAVAAIETVAFHEREWTGGTGESIDHIDELRAQP